MVGDFNPKIFQPAWFGMEGLIRKNEFETADIQIIHSDIVAFNVKDWLSFNVTRERLSAETAQEAYYEILRDLIVGTFKILRHTPIKMMGINHNRHFLMDSTEEWHRFGDKLAPKEYWKKILTKPGMRSLTIEDIRPDNFKGYIRITVEPSIRTLPDPGVFFQVNDHFEAKDPENTLGADEIINILENVWDESCNRSKEIIKTILLESQ
ncbi:MAG: hypothetical protein L0Y68_04180 [Candidatus Dadabacteria bacterium]|nr:hypothetical protein [Candidatus Dadabacteria bacterium]